MGCYGGGTRAATRPCTSAGVSATTRPCTSTGISSSSRSSATAGISSSARTRAATGVGSSARPCATAGVSSSARSCAATGVSTSTGTSATAGVSATTRPCATTGTSTSTGTSAAALIRICTGMMTTARSAPQAATGKKLSVTGMGQTLAHGFSIVRPRSAPSYHFVITVKAAKGIDAFLKSVMLMPLKRGVARGGYARLGHAFFTQRGKKSGRRHFPAIDDDGRVRGCHQVCQGLTRPRCRKLHARRRGRVQVIFKNQPGAVLAGENEIISLQPDKKSLHGEIQFNA